MDRLLTKDEIKWLKKFQKLMNECPCKTLGGYITGDPTLTIYDKPLFDSYQQKHGYIRDTLDDVTIHREIDSVLWHIEMPFSIDGVCG